MDLVWLIVQKELAQALRNRITLFTLIFSTVLFILIPLGLAYGMSPDGPFPTLPGRQVDAATLQNVSRALPALAGLDARHQLLGLLLASMQSLFLIIPIMIPLIIAVYSVIGEKQTRSLEAVLATPITTRELLAGKCLAAAIPGVASAWVSYGLFALLAYPVTRGAIFGAVLVRPAWLLALLLLVPGAAGLAVILGLIVSSRASDPQAAQQLAGVVVLPVIGLVVGQISGVVQLSPLFVLLTALVLLAVDGALLAVAVRLFQRETILTRWK